MLTGKLVRVRYAKNRLIPQYVDSGNAALRALAEQMLATYRASIGRTRGEIADDLADLIPEGPRGLLPGGLAKLLEERCEFEVEAEHAPEELREAVFKVAVRHRVDAARTGIPFDRLAVMREAVETLSLTITTEQIDLGLFADLKDEQRVQSFDDITPERLLDRYNVALAQAILLRCTMMEARVWGESPARFRQLFRSVKFHKLICSIHESGGNSYTLKLDGPLSLFSSTQKYGVQLANFFPNLLHCKAFDLKASVRWGAERKEKQFALSSSDGLRSHLPEFGVYTPPELQMFAESFTAKVKGWVLSTDPNPISLSDGVWVPDFKLTHAATGKEIFTEVFGFWRKGDIQQHYRKLQKEMAGRFVLCVADQMRTDEDDEVTLGKAVYRYKRTPLPEEVARMAELVAGI